MDDNKLEKWLDDYADRCNRDNSEWPSSEACGDDQECVWYLAGRMDGDTALTEQRYTPKAFAQSILAGEVWAEMHEDPEGEYVLATALTEQAREIVDKLKSLPDELYEFIAPCDLKKVAEYIEREFCPADTDKGTD